MKDRLRFIITMLIFGTVGILVRWISLPSGIIALVRGGIATLLLLMLSRFTKDKTDKAVLKLVDQYENGLINGFTLLSKALEELENQ